MSEFLSTAVVILSMVAAFAGLVVWVRRDTFTAKQFRQPEVDTVEREDTPPLRVAATVVGRHNRVLQVSAR